MNSQKQLAIDILTPAFDTNLSVNFIVKQDASRVRRIERLMDYSYDVADRFGKIAFSEDNKACMLLVDQSKKKTSLTTVLWDLKLVFGVIGPFRLRKVLKREASVNHEKPVEDYIYLWFIGVDPEKQGRGLGSELVKDLINDPWRNQKPIYLETSNPKNFPFYEKLGFSHCGTVQSEGYEMRQYLYQD